jgi:hypothetical protein
MDDTTAEATHPPGIIVKIVGIEKGDRGRSYEEHDVCGPSNKVLRIELGGEERGLNNEIECVYAHALLAMLEDVPEQELFKRLQLPKRSGVSRLPLAL